MGGKNWVLISVFIFGFIFENSASATIFLDGNRIEAEGILYHQSIWRSANLHHEYNYIQGRNQLDLKVLFHMVGENGYVKPFGIIDGIDLRLIGRGFYDSVYDVTNDWGSAGGFFSGHLENGIRNNIEKYVDLREAYVDIFMGPLALRVGKQQIVWGKTDFFRLLDIINPLDYSWHFFFESFDDIRIPQKMAKALLSVGDLGPFRDVSLEFVVNPRDFNSTNLGHFGMPWALAPAGFELYKKNKPFDEPQYGGRIQARIGGFSFTINDYYTFQQDPVFSLAKGALTYPRINVLGGAIDYYDNFSKSVLRLELTYVKDKKMGVDFTSPYLLEFLTNHPTGRAEKKEIKYCIGIDRPTWIRFLNQKQTFFLSGQLFMTHILDWEKAITDDGVPTRKRGHPIVTILTNTTYMNGRLTPQIYWTWDVQSRNSHIIGPSIQYLISNYFNVKLGSNLFWGQKKARYTYFGAYKDYDELYIRVQFNF